MIQTIEFQIPEELLRLVDERAETAGLPREAHIRGEILAPFRDQVAGSGISDEDLDRLFSQARDEFYRERRSVPYSMPRPG